MTLPKRYRGLYHERFAVWEAHQGACCYCHRFIEFEVAEIDHVVPQDLAKPDKQSELELLKMGIADFFEFPEHFSIHSFYNVVPSCRLCNNRKRNKETVPRELASALREARRKYSDVENVYSKVTKSRKKNELLAILDSNIRDQNISIEDIRSVQKMYIDDLNATAMIEIEVSSGNSTIVAGIEGDISDPYFFEYRLEDLTERQKNQLPFVDQDLIVDSILEIKDGFSNKRYKYFVVRNRGTNTLFLTQEELFPIQAFLPKT